MKNVITDADACELSLKHFKNKTVTPLIMPCPLSVLALNDDRYKPKTPKRGFTLWRFNIMMYADRREFGKAIWAYQVFSVRSIRPDSYHRKTNRQYASGIIVPAHWHNSSILDQDTDWYKADTV